jgi:hypothetical protein
LHKEIADLGKASRIKAATLVNPKFLESSLAKQRGNIREGVKEILDKINPLVKGLIT